MAVLSEEGGGRPRSLRPYRSHEEHVWAMKEDLAEWLAALYDIEVGAADFLEQLETGTLLCRHANRVSATAKRRGRWTAELAAAVLCRADVQPGTFHARDNVHNFIQWCRTRLSIPDCLLFETDDLVMRKNERNVVLCLMEVARRGVRLGMPPPLLVQMEREIDAEIAATNSPRDSDGGHDADCDSETEPPPPPRQIVTNDLRSLHERVADLLNRCSCPAQFPMLQVGDGKYRIGETQLLIFVRVLRNHVMVRVGGGWDTLEHYLDKHDPCRCRSGRRISVNRVSPSSSGSIQVHLNSHRSPSGTSSSSRSSSVPTSPPSRRRSFDISTGGVEWPLRRNRPSSADSSSEVSSEAERNNDRRQRRFSPRKVMRTADSHSESTEDSLKGTPTRSRIPTCSPSPRRMSASRSETSLFQHQQSRSVPHTPRRVGVARPPRSVSTSPARNVDWGASRRTLSLQSSPVKPVPPLLEEILQDSEVLDSDQKILERMERLINEYRAREPAPQGAETIISKPVFAKGVRRNSLSKIPVMTWNTRQ